jgi:hypothetical protein
MTANNKEVIVFSVIFKKYSTEIPINLIVENSNKENTKT